MMNAAILSIAHRLNMVALVAFLASAAAVYTAPHLGWRVDAVYTESMAPKLRRGTLVIAGPVEPSAIAVNDIIIFRPMDATENYVAHRVIAVETGIPPRFVTKGDASTTPDPLPVPEQNVVARVRFYLAALGYAVMFLKTRTGFVMAFVIPSAVLTAACLKGIASEVRKTARRPA